MPKYKGKGLVSFKIAWSDSVTTAELYKERLNRACCLLGFAA